MGGDQGWEAGGRSGAWEVGGPLAATVGALVESHSGRGTPRNWPGQAVCPAVTGQSQLLDADAEKNQRYLIDTFAHNYIPAFQGRLTKWEN